MKPFGGKFGAVVNGGGGMSSDSKTTTHTDYFDQSSIDPGLLLSTSL